MNKKGAEMTVGTLIIILLALLVLVVLVFGFTTGWSNLWSKIVNFFGGGSNVDSVKQACEVACATNAKYEYCCVVRDVRTQQGASAVKETCNSFNVGCTSFSCSPADCARVVCLNTEVVTADKCPGGRTISSTITLDSDLLPLAKQGKICCVNA